MYYIGQNWKSEMDKIDELNEFEKLLKKGNNQKRKAMLKLKNIIS